jgi:ecotin
MSAHWTIGRCRQGAIAATGALLRGCLLLLATLAGVAPAFAADNMKAFPAAEAGMTRHVISVPKQDDESAFRVELMIGKTVRTDPGNRYFFTGTLETVPIAGWGFERHVLRQLGPMAGTLVAVDPGTPQVDRFIGLGGEPRLLRYNSRLPLVVYVPEGVEVRHRIWSAGSGARFLRKLALPAGQTAVVAEGDFEARSIGSYSVRVYSSANAQPGDDTTFFSSGIVRARDGTLEQVLLADLGDGAGPTLVVTIRSAGSGSYQSADAFRIGKNTIVLHASAAELPADADPVAALKSVVKGRQQK